MKRIFLLCMMLAAANAPAQGPAPSAVATPRLDTKLGTTPSRIVPVDRIIAVVNDEVITQNDLTDRVALVVRQLQRQGGQLPAQDVLTRQILDRMVNDLVQIQMAKENGIKIDDVTLDKTIQRIADENNLSMSDFRATLEKDGIRYVRFREDIRNEVLLARLREREVDQTVVVTDAEVETELARESKERDAGSEYRLAHILVTVPQQATPDQIEARRRRALQALSELRQGSNFVQVAATYSDAPDALQGGNLGWRDSGRVPALFLDAIMKLKPDEVSDILRSPNGFHLIKLLEVRGKAKADAVPQTHARHILLRPKEGVSDAEARERLVRLRERVLGGADFAELAKVHSDDASATKGGDLGWVSPGDTVPEFEKAMNGLRDGEVSQPIQTPFGWHLVQVVERRADDASEDRRKMNARQSVKVRKSDEAFQDWLRQARDKAYVENRYDER